jgi:(p)ppGpp synthase/HD superfamily hydrolase
MRLSPRYGAALQVAFDLHADQVRKGSGVPYFAHLAGVSSLVLEHGGTEDEAIAALLHDAVEDQGGRETLTRIATQFGDHVAAIVEGCTDALDVPKPPWRARKERYLDHLGSAPASVQLVSACDKLYNAQSIVRDHHSVGEQVWTRFTEGRDGVLWYYRSLAAAFTLANPVVQELRAAVDQMQAMPSSPEAGA